MKKAVILAAAAIALVGVVPTRAAPSTVEIEAVYRARDCARPCNPSRDDGLDGGTVVNGTIHVHVHAASEVFGIEWVRLEAQNGDDPRFYCLQEWNAASATSFRARHVWDTNAWPNPGVNSDCAESNPLHRHGEPTVNDAYRFRVSAREAASREVAESDDFLLAVINAPDEPVWEHAVRTGRDVALRWRANTEPDLVEYIVTRTGPDGRTRFVVDAGAPGRVGCTQRGASMVCTDRLGGPSGSYRYVVRARRKAPRGDERCARARERCIGTTSDARAVVLPSGPAAVLPPDPTSPGTSRSARPTTGPERAPSEPGGAPTDPTAVPPSIGSTSHLPRRTSIFLATVLLLTTARAVTRRALSARSR